MTDVKRQRNPNEDLSLLLGVACDEIRRLRKDADAVDTAATTEHECGYCHAPTGNTSATWSAHASVCVMHPMTPIMRETIALLVEATPYLRSDNRRARWLAHVNKIESILR